MQYRFDFLSNDLRRWHAVLQPSLRTITLLPPLAPHWMLVKAMISGRTRDAVSQAAFDGLCEEFGSLEAIASAPSDRIEQTIGAVTHADRKARHLVAALDRIRSHHGSYGLDHLSRWTVDDAKIHLEALPGVGAKVAATTLNASTLAFPIMIVDTSVLRVLQRLGVVSSRATYGSASASITGALPDWNGARFLEFHVQMKLVGQHICTFRRPRCGLCPLAADCPSAGATLH